MTIETQIDQLKAEVVAVKRQNRLLWTVFTLTLAILLAWRNFDLPFANAAHAGSPPDAAKELRATRFTIVDEKGNALLSLGRSGDIKGIVALTPTGKPICSLEPQEAGPVLRLWDSKGNVRLGAGVTQHGPSIMMSTDDGKPYMMLSGKQLALYGDDGQSFAELAVARTGSTLSLDDGKFGFKLSLKKGDLSHSIYESPEIGYRVLKMPAQGPLLELYDHRGRKWSAP